jgi:hypothetical protein
VVLGNSASKSEYFACLCKFAKLLASGCARPEFASPVGSVPRFHNIRQTPLLFHYLFFIVGMTAECRFGAVDDVTDQIGIGCRQSIGLAQLVVGGLSKR